MSIGKVLGFLGLTSDVTGFELDLSILAVGLAVSIVIQLLKDNAEQSDSSSKEEIKLVRKPNAK
jgi:hypothetical protein